MTDKDKFIPHGSFTITPHNVMLVQVSEDGSSARYLGVFQSPTDGSKRFSRGKWQEIRYTSKGCRPYIMCYGRKSIRHGHRLYIDNFLRVR